MNEDNKFALILLVTVVIIFTVGFVATSLTSIYKAEATAKMDPMSACFAYANTNEQFKICKDIKPSRE